MVLSKTAREFILHWGEMGSRWGVNRTVAQVHALLYLSPQPLTAEDIAEALSVARSNVSSSLRELQNWQLVQATHQMGDRRDFFSTSHDVWQLFLTVIQQRVEREIEPTIAALGRLAAEARTEKQPEVTARIAGMHAFLQEMHGLVPAGHQAAAKHTAQPYQHGSGRHQVAPRPAQSEGSKSMTTDVSTLKEALTESAPATQATPQISLEQYYSEAGPDYAAWSRGFNMHFGYYRAGANPFRREAMLEQMNAEVLTRLHVSDIARPKLLDLGCGLGATLRSFARRIPNARLFGLTRVPWQVDRACALNEAAGCSQQVRILEGDYEDTILPRASYDGVYALESSCHAHGADKAALLSEAHRLLRPGGRLVVADGFLTSTLFNASLQQRIYRKLCECWVIEELAQLNPFTATLQQLGFNDITIERLQLRVAPSVAHIPWVTLTFLLTDVVFGKRKMTRARWNNVLAPVLLPLVSAPLGPMTYCMISATKR